MAIRYVPAHHEWTWKWDATEGRVYIVWPDDRYPFSDEAADSFPCDNLVTAGKQGDAWAAYYNLMDTLTDMRNAVDDHRERLDQLLKGD